MDKRLRVLTTCAFVLASAPIAASAQQSPDRPLMPAPVQLPTTQPPTNPEVPGMMDQGGLMGRRMTGEGGMVGPGMMSQGMMGHMGMRDGRMGSGGAMPGIMMRIIFSLMDSDGDGTISLQEFQAAHERIFKAMDANKDGRLTPEEMQGFMQGSRTQPTQR